MITAGDDCSNVSVDSKTHKMPSGHPNSLNSCKTSLMKTLQLTNEITMSSMLDTRVKPWMEEGIDGDHHRVFQQGSAHAHIANKIRHDWRGA